VVDHSNAVSVECPFPKPDWLTSSWLFRDRKDDTFMVKMCLKILTRVFTELGKSFLLFCTMDLEKTTYIKLTN